MSVNVSVSESASASARVCPNGFACTGIRGPVGARGPTGPRGACGGVGPRGPVGEPGPNRRFEPSCLYATFGYLDRCLRYALTERRTAFPASDWRVAVVTPGVSVRVSDSTVGLLAGGLYYVRVNLVPARQPQKPVYVCILDALTGETLGTESALVDAAAHPRISLCFQTEPSVLLEVDAWNSSLVIFRV